MKHPKRPRAKVRLRLDRGTALLKQLGVSSVMCVVLDFSETGCSCRISLADVNQEDAHSWLKLIVPGRVLTLEITEPMDMSHLQFAEAEVRWVKAVGDRELEFGVLLKNLEPEQHQLLHHALLALATGKLRKNSSATGVTPSAPAGMLGLPTSEKKDPESNV